MSHRLPVTNSRPITKGLQRTALRTASTRRLQDKSYWTGQIRQKMEEIQQETVKLAKDNSILKQDQETMAIYEKKAEILRDEVGNMTSELKYLNLIQEKCTVSESLDYIFEEMDGLQDEKYRLENVREEFFAQRRTIDQQTNHLEQEMSVKEDQLFSKLQSDLRPEEFDAYNENLKEFRETFQLNSMTNSNLMRLHNEIESYTASFQAENHAGKLKLVRDIKSLAENQQKNSKLSLELDTIEAPIREEKMAQQKIEELKSILDKTEEKIEKEERETEKIADQKNELDERLAELTTGLGNKIIIILEKYKKLQSLMEGFENTADQEKREFEQTKANLENLQHEKKSYESGILRLEKMDNPGKSNTQFTDSQNISNLKEKLNELYFEETKYKEQISNNSENLDKIRTDIAIYNDVATLKQTAAEKQENLMEERETLGKKKSQFQQAANEKSRKTNEISSLLHGNKVFTKIEKLEGDLKNTAKICVDKEDMVQRQLADDATPVISKVRQLSNDHNTWLVDRLQRGVGIQIE